MKTRWSITQNKRAIEWRVCEGDLHTDDIEMAGFSCAHVVKYGMDENGFVLMHHPVFPTLRTRPNITTASYQLDIPGENTPRLCVNGERVYERLTRVQIDGVLTLETEAGSIALTHVCFPSTKLRAVYEVVTVENRGDCEVTLSLTCQSHKLEEKRGPMGINVLEAEVIAPKESLAPGETAEYVIAFTGRLANEEKDFCALCDIYTSELEDRRNNVNRLIAPLCLDTGNEVLDTMFAFAKLRAGESVFDTMYGLVHSPGGFYYYAATWCNDEVEYAGPYFAYTGDKDLLEASMNAYRMYMPFMSDSYDPIPSSVIAEGVDYWDGAGDRGDAAMYLYGA